MNTAPAPLVGHNLTRRHTRSCQRYLADHRLAAGPLLGCFHIAAPFLPRGVRTLLAVTGQHVVLVSISRSTGSVSHLAASRAACRLQAGAIAPPGKGSTRPLVLTIEGRDRTLIAHDADLPAISQLIQPGQESLRPRGSSPVVGAPHGEAAAPAGRAARRGFRFRAWAAGAAAAVLAGVLGAVMTLQEDQTDSLRRSFDAYRQAVNNARPEDALRFLTPYSRKHLDRARWRAKFSARGRPYAMLIDHVRLSTDGLSAKVATTGGRQGLARRVSVQTWKKLQGRWYRAYLEDIPDMMLHGDPPPRLVDNGLLGAR